MRLLLLSNSTNPGEEYLGYPKNNIREFLGSRPVTALFIPYAAVTFSYDEYEKKVQDRFREIGHEIVSIHHFQNPVKAVMNSTVIVIGGGNTWKLLKMLEDNELIEAIREKIITGTPYIGWSAGSNVACPTIKTTNDMPVVEPRSFKAMNLIPFQINPHFTDVNPVNHGGESREDRINEFIETNPGTYVIGLREGTMLLREDEKIVLIGTRKARIFKKLQKPLEKGSTDDLAFLLE